LAFAVTALWFGKKLKNEPTKRRTAGSGLSQLKTIVRTSPKESPKQRRIPYRRAKTSQIVRLSFILALVLFLLSAHAATEALPDVKALMAEADANQKKIDLEKENFAGARIEVETMTDTKGEVLQQGTNQFTFFYVRGQEVAMLRVRNGHTLSGEAQKKEKERSRKVMAKLVKTGKKPAAKKDEEEDVEIATFLRVATIGPARREIVTGRKVVMLDFAPNPKFKAQTEEEKIAQRLEGTICIDEESRVVRRIEARLASDYRVGGLTAKLKKGSMFVVEQDLFDGVWLPSHEEGAMRVSVLGIKEIAAKLTTQYVNYKRLSPEELARMTSP
jgi:hypothetical protein